ncbi:hypothetical protein N8T08_009483 [Aspergillus melleus]|uniref:Uncharacterized protein n=1 Tax=Aspergillus melleus TaxID=138277 RepID=A0ACC3BCX9_9EURO|nr:hypothetical protein N8T08_009483 [Aspergillus melleus]
MADTTLLHMAKAGTGEAMILEYGPAGQRKFVIIDGGPAYWSSPASQDIPYYKYFIAAAKKIWTDGGQTASFNPSAIINSSTDEDHYRGLVSYLRSIRSKKEPFRGPIVVPSVKSLGLFEIEAVLGKGDLKWASQPGFPSEALSGLICDRPARESIKTYNAKLSGTATETETETADHEDLNTAGDILMHTDPKSTRKGHVFLASDDAGWQISPSVADKRYSIYKIQDHGRWRNTQLTKENRVVTDGVKRETALRSLFAVNVRGYTNLQETSLLQTRARALFSHICTSHSFTLESAATYLTDLDKRGQSYLTACASNLKDANGNFATELNEAHGGDALDPVPSKVMLQAEKWVQSLKPSDPAFSLFYSVQESKVKPVDEWVQWTTSNNWATLYLRTLSIFSIRDFFQSFSADAYSVSGNWESRHELAPTIVGLALAMHKKKCTAILYLTDPSALAVQDMAFYCTVLSEDIATLFKSTSLSIRFLSQGSYMTLNGDESSPANGRDVQHWTSELQLATASRVTIDEVEDQLGSDESKLAGRFKTPEGGYQVSSTNAGTTSYLTLTAPNKPGVQTNKPSSLAVVESWSSAAQDHDVVQFIQATAGNSLNGAVMQLGQPSESDSWRLTWVNQDNGDETTFYVNNITGVVTEGSVKAPPGTGSSVALFKLEPTTANAAVPTPSLELPPNADDKLAASPSLRSYCDAAGIAVTASFSGLNALAALVGHDHVSSLGFSLDVEEAALAFIVKIDSSTVDFVDNGISLAVNAARIHFMLSETSTVPFGSTKLRVTTQTLELTWSANLALSATLYTQLERGIKIEDTKSVANATRATPLRKCLLGMGMSAEALATIKIPKLLSFLSDRPACIANMFEEQLPAALVKSGIAALRPDLTQSVVQASHTPSKQTSISHAKIVCDLGSVTSWDKKLTILGKTLTIKTMNVIVTNAATAAQQISFTGSASMQLVAGVEFAVEWSTVLDTVHAGEWFFSLRDATVDTLSQIFPGIADIPNLTIPIAESPLSSLLPSVAGFSVKQPVASVSDYCVNNISMAVTIAEDTWKKILPAAFPVQKIGLPTIRVNVQNPVTKDRRQIAVDVEVKLKTAIALQVRFGAEPLPGSKHEFRMRITGPSKGVTVAQIANEIGLGSDISSNISSVIPIVGDFLSRAHVHVLCPALTLQGSTWVFGDWRLSVSLNVWPITDSIILHGTHLDLESINGLIAAKGTSSLFISNKKVDVVVKTPQTNLPGEVRITAPNGISAADLLKALHLPDLSDIPQVGSLLSVQLESASCTMDYSKTNARKLTCTGASVICTGKKVSIGPLILVGVYAAFNYHSEDDPLGLGKAQKTFCLSATLEDNSFQVDASYDDARLGSIQLLLTRKSKVTLNQTVAKLLPSEITNVLAPVLGSLTVDRVEVSFDTKSKKFTSFEIIISNMEPLTVDKVVLSSLSVSYKAAVPAETNSGGTPTSLNIKGSVSKNTFGASFEISCLPNSKVPTEVDFLVLPLRPNSLSLASFIDLLGVEKAAWHLPSGSPNFLTFQVTKINGRIAVQTGSEKQKTLTISQLEAVVETSAKLTVLQNLNVKLDDVRLDLKYTKGEGLSAQFTGRLSLKSPAVNVWVRYSKEPDAQFEGQLTTIEGDYDAKELANKFLTDDQFKIPDNVKFPDSLPLVSVHVLVKPSVSVKVWGMGQRKWNPTLSGVEIEMASLGASVEVREPKADDSKADETNEDDSKPDEPEPDESKPDVPEVGETEAKEPTADEDGRDDMKNNDVNESHPKDNEKAAEPKKAKEYEIHIIGTLNFTSFTTATASLDIKSNRGLILKAAVKKKANADKAVEDLTDQLASNDNAKFAEISKSSAIPGSALAVADKDLQLYLDFGQKFFYLAGAIGNNITALILGRPKHSPGPQGAGGRNYVVSVVVQDLNSLWPEFNSTVGQVLDWEVLAAEIIAYDGTYAQLTEDLKTAYSQLKIEGSNDASSVVASQEGATGIGVLFFGKISLKGHKEMTDAVKMIVEEDKPAEVIISAVVKKKVAESQLVVSISKLTLWGGHLILSDAKGTYKEKKFSVAGKLAATFEGLEELKFDINLVIAPGSTTFKAITTIGNDTGDTKTIKPFGKFQFHMNKFSIEAKFFREDSERKSEVTIMGDATLGARAGLTGSLIFVNGAPSVASLDFKDLEISIDQVVKELVNGSTSGANNAVEWPSDYQALELKLKDLYYAKSDQTIGEKKYTTGFHISALCKLFSDQYNFSLDAAFAAPGLKVEAKYTKSVDLDFVKIRDTSISIDTTDRTEKKYTGTTMLTLLDLKPTSITLGYESSDHSYTGTFTYDGEILGVTKPTIKFKYSKKKKFQVVEWPIPAELQDALDLVKGIEEASKTTGKTDCGALTDMVLNIVKTNFSLKVSLGGADSTENNKDNKDKTDKKKEVSFYISGTFTICLETEKVADIEMPQLHGTLSKFDSKGLLDAIKNLLINNVEALGKQIMENGEAFSKLFATIAAVKIGKELLKKAMCREIKTKNVKDRAKQEANSQEDEVNKQSKEVEDALEAAESAASVGGLASSLAEAESALAALGLLIVGLVGFLSSLLAFFGVESPEQKEYNQMKERVEKLKEKLAEELTKKSESMEDVLKMQGFPTCTFVSGDTLRVEWAQIRPKSDKVSFEDYKGFTWTVTVSLSGKDNDPTNYDVSVKDQTSTEIRNSQFLYIRTVYAWVKATYTKDGRDWVSSTRSDQGSRSHVPSLPPPKVSFTLTPGQCTVTVDPVNPEQYRIEIAGADDRTRRSILYNPDPATLSQNPLQIPWTLLQVPKSLPSSVRAYVQRLSSNPQSHNDSPWAKSTEEIRLAPVPQDLNAEMNNSSENTDVDVNWKQPGEATDTVDYELQVLRADTKEPLPSVDKIPQSAETGNRKIRLSSPEFIHGLQIVITVQVLNNDNAIALTVFKRFKILTTSKQPPSCDFLPLGALIQRFRVGNQNIVLGYDSPNDYIRYRGPQFGKTIGRVSNRIENGTFELNDVDYHLPQTDGYCNTTDGGVRGWGMCMFQGPTKEKRNELDATLFTYRGEDGEEGFPGQVELKVWYMESHGRTATGKRTTVFIVEYEAELTGDEPESTVINVTNRSYFNLTDEPSIEGTKDKGGWMMDTRANELKTLGSFSKGNIHLRVQSTEPAFQFNTGDHLKFSENPQYGPRAGFYIEPCRFINAINSPKWRSMVILRQGEKYGYKNVYTAWEE